MKGIKVSLVNEDGKISGLFDFRVVMEDVAHQAWYDTGLNTREFQAVGNNVSLVFYGHIYEPAYEYFTSGCNVYGIKNGEKQCLFEADKKNIERYLRTAVNCGAYDNIISFLRENMKMGIMEVAKKCS